MKKKFQTGKLVLWICLCFEFGLLGIVVYGWLRGLMEAPQMFQGVCALIIATVVGYFAKSTFENISKGKTGANILPDVLTILQGIFNALQSGDVASAMSSIINAMQMIVQNHPDLSQADAPILNQNSNMGENLGTSNQTVSESSDSKGDNK